MQLLIQRRIVGTGLLVLLMACERVRDSSTASEEISTFPAIRAALPPSEAQSLLVRCDGTAVRADSLWSPTDSTLRVLEHRLNEHLASTNNMPINDEELSDYSLQYSGIFRDGRKLVVVNGVHRYYLQRIVERDTSDGIPRNERVARLKQWFSNNAFSVCDGGRGFFRAEYDVSVNRITFLIYNQSER